MSGIHLILVDDDDLMLRILEPSLPELPTDPPIASIATALDPHAAIRAIERAPPGPMVVLSDFNLKATLNGIDVLKEAAKQRPDSVRVLISGYAIDQIGDVTGDGVVHGFIEKPMRVHEMYGPLADIIHQVLRQRR